MFSKVTEDTSKCKHQLYLRTSNKLKGISIKYSAIFITKKKERKKKNLDRNAHAKNYKTLMKKNFKDPSEWRDGLCSWIRRLHTVGMRTLRVPIASMSCFRRLGITGRKHPVRRGKQLTWR